MEEHNANFLAGAIIMIEWLRLYIFIKLFNVASLYNDLTAFQRTRSHFDLL